jgi:hypothetical protein
LSCSPLAKIIQSISIAMFSHSVRWFCGLRDSLLDQARRAALHNVDSHPEVARALAILNRFDAGRTYSCVEEEDSTGCMVGHPQFGQVGWGIRMQGVWCDSKSNSGT